MSPLSVALVGALLAASALVDAAPIGRRCSATISSIDDVDAAKLCTSITIKAFTVPAKTTFDLTGLLDGTTVTVAGDVAFAGYSKGWAGPLFSISGSDITFDGGGHEFDGNGADYWDGKGSNGGITKPKFMKVTMGGTLSNLNILSAPVQCFSIGNKEKLVIDAVKIDNTAGDALGSNGKALGHNSDCFDVSATGTTIQNSFCYNQDDCLAVNKGSDISFLDNYCSGGHGISIGSIQSDKTVSDVTISGNTVVKSTNGLRIKTVYKATGASVSGVTYSGNTVTDAEDYGVVIQQDYENGSPTGTATNGVTISDVSFTGSTNTVSVGDDGLQVYVLCGSDSCTGDWDWSALKTSGGKKPSVSPSSVPITGFSF